MSFKVKTDPFGMEDSSLSCISTSDNKSAQLVEATDQYGTIKASEVFGQTIAPNAEYRLKADKSIDIVLGSVTTFDGQSVALGNVSINTGAGTPPTITASGEQVEANGTANCTYETSATVEFCHHAQILFGAFTLTGDGCYLQTANYTASATITKATKDGVCIAHDVVEGKIEATIEVKQTGSTAPTVSAGTGWTITSPLACTNPDSDYSTYSATLTKYLERTSA